VCGGAAAAATGIEWRQKHGLCDDGHGINLLLRVNLTGGWWVETIEPFKDKRKKNPKADVRS